MDRFVGCFSLRGVWYILVLHFISILRFQIIEDIRGSVLLYFCKAEESKIN